MNWYNEEIQIRDQPLSVVIEIQGQYNESNPDLPRIIIRLVRKTDNIEDTISMCNVYTHNPTSLVYEEPTSDQILAKYSPKIQKLKKILSGLDYEEFIRKYEI